MAFHRLRTHRTSARLLGGELFTLAGHFTSTSSCLVCGNAVGPGRVSLVTVLSSGQLLARVAHPSCSSPRHSVAGALPLPAEVGYEYRVGSIPVVVEDQHWALPTVLLRLGVDAAVLVPAPAGGWDAVSLSVPGEGFEPPGEVLPYSPASSASPVPGGLHLSVAGGFEVDVLDPALEDAARAYGGVLVVVVPSGSVEGLVSQEALVSVLSSPSTRLALVELSGPAPSGPGGSLLEES